MRLVYENRQSAGRGHQSMRASLEEEAAAIMAEIARLEQVAGQVV